MVFVTTEMRAKSSFEAPYLPQFPFCLPQPRKPKIVNVVFTSMLLWVTWLSVMPRSHYDLLSSSIVSIETGERMVEQQFLDDITKPRMLKSDGPDPEKHLNGKFAYTYIVSGCDESSCIGYILNVLAASQILRHSESIADVVLMVRMAATSNYTRLLPQQEEWLEKGGVQLRYLPKVRKDNFGTATLEKFRVLEMTEYDRVLFMDGDAIPLCNMDYLFIESYRPDGILSEYVALEGGIAPFTGSTFLVTPKEGEFTRIMDIVRRHRERALNPNLFDEKIGWGHEMSPNDPWISYTRTGNLWNFKAAASDQGLLYHWLKYQHGNFTFVQLYRIEQWEEVTYNLADWQKNETTIYPIEGNRYIAPVRSWPNSDLIGCGGERYGRDWWSNYPPFGDLYHFAGRKKPWAGTIDAQLIPSSYSAATDARDVWTYWLAEANRTRGLDLPSVINVLTKNPLGLKDPGNHILDPDVELPVESTE